jgi:hypothetical protein
VAREEFLLNTITTKKLTQRGTVVYPVVRPSPTLAYSMLWRPNGRGLHSTPFKRSKDPLEYHGVSESRLEGGVNRANLKFTKFKHNYKPG